VARTTEAPTNEAPTSEAAAIYARAAPVPISPALPPVGGSDDGMSAFGIAWSTSKFSRQKLNIRMSAQDQPVFFGRRFTLGPTGATWSITPPDQTFDNPTARLYNRSRRFWLKGSSGEMFGMHFYNIDGRRSAPRAFHLVLPNIVPYIPPTEELGLSQIAKAKVAPWKAVRLLSSKLPTKKEDGRMCLSFGNVFVITSVKNFIVEDEQGETLFVIYRSSDTICTVKVRAPLTRLIAFGMAIAIISSDR
jgi:hypothetical protein